MPTDFGSQRASGALSNKASSSLTALELFAGAGGMSLGVHQAGFKHLGLVEWNESAAETIRLNSQQVLGIGPEIVLVSDAREVDYGLYANKTDLMFGGPPCQPFSTGGRSQGAEDRRNMFPIFLDAMSVVMPKAILLENVRGLIRDRFKDYYRYILKRLQFPLLKTRSDETWKDHYRRLLAVKESDFSGNEQYVAGYQIIDTANYGVPQRRLRVFISAFRRDLDAELFRLQPTHSEEELLREQWLTGTYWERVGIEPYDYLGKTDRRLLERLRTNSETPGRVLLPWRTVREAIGDLRDPVPRGKKPEIPNHTQHPGARIYKGHIGSFWDYPAKALKAGTHGTPGGENVLRVKSDGSVVRYFTTREAARLQTFPDEWVFLGSWGACIKQLGNAVPVDVARLFAEEIKDHINASPNQEEDDNDAENHR